MITSVQNPKIQWVRKIQAQAKARREEGSFIAEGVRLVEEALQSGWEAPLVLYTTPLIDRGVALVAAWQTAGVPVEEVSPHVLAAASDTQSPQGVLAVLKVRALPLPEKPTFLLVADGVRDPGNLGTILRTALAAGVQAVLLPPGAVDSWSPKVVRAAMGAHFHLPIVSLDWAAIASLVHPAEGPALQVLLADSGGGIPHTSADLQKPLALVIGSEAEGVGAPAAALADGRVHIPMPGAAESLNAAVAAAVLMFEVARQRASGLPASN
jgi:TrmH family RNA methyltransferase